MVSLRSFRVVAALAAVLAAWPAAAQPAAGKLAGVVKDTTGAAIPGATITVAHATTHATQTVTTGTDGSYSLGLPAGLYTVSVALKGFGGQSRQVEVGAASTADFTLEPRSSEEVTVTAMLREQSLSDVPFSIAAPTEGELRARGADDIEDVAANVAGFTVQNLGP